MIYSVEELARLCEPGSLQVVYNVDAADVLSMSMKPTAWAEVGWQRWDRLELMVGERRVFSGLLVGAPAHGVDAGSGESVQLQFYSDWWVLEQTQYLRMNDDGVMLYPSVREDERWMGAGAFLSGVFEWASSWSGSRVETGFRAEASERVPAPNGGGVQSCASLMLAANRWLPDAHFVQRYDADGMMLYQRTAEDEGELVLDAAGGYITGVSLTAHPEAVPPVCALVGGEHMVLPEGGDVREPGSFVYAVPVDDAGEGVPGGSAASAKMVIKGVALPERKIFVKEPSEYTYAEVVAPSKGYTFICAFWPQFKALLGGCSMGACLVERVEPEDLMAEEAEEVQDEDALDEPQNYGDPSEWNDAVYVLTEGSFTASSTERKNLRGLKWCRARLSVMLRLPVEALTELEAELQAVALELFPSVFEAEDAEGEKTRCLVGRLELDAVLINRRKRIFDPATNAPCKADAEYEEATDTEATGTDYKEALTRFYAGSRAVPHEGNVEVLVCDELPVLPEQAAGCRLSLTGLRDEWAGMQTVVRSVAWDVAGRKLSLSVGGPGVLGFDEYLQRALLRRLQRAEAAMRQVVPYDLLDDEAAEAAEAAMSVSPSVSASVAAVTTAIYRKPFTLYVVQTGDASEVWLKGGVLQRGATRIEVPDTPYMLRHMVATEQVWTLGKDVYTRWVKVDGVWTLNVYQKD